MQDDNDGGQLVLFDLQTTTARSRVRIQCKQIVANPLWAPDRGLISVTCGADLVVLDGKRFTELRRVRYVLPGCDNGNNLPAHFITPTVLQIEGCGGIAKLDLATGRYLCGDNEGVLGAEYEMMANPTHPRRKVPKVPVCEETNADFLPISAHYKYSYTEEELIGPNGLHIKMPRPTIAPDESRAAFVRDQKLVVLALPSGTPIQLPE